MKKNPNIYVPINQLLLLEMGHAKASQLAGAKSRYSIKRIILD